MNTSLTLSHTETEGKYMLKIKHVIKYLLKSRLKLLEHWEMEPSYQYSFLLLLAQLSSRFSFVPLASDFASKLFNWRRDVREVHGLLQNSSVLLKGNLFVID